MLCWFTICVLLVCSSFVSGVDGRIMTWGNPKVIKRRKLSLERARAIVNRHDNLEDLVVDSLSSLTLLLSPSIESLVESAVGLIEQAEIDLSKGKFDNVLNSAYFTRVMLELRRVLPYVSQFPIMDNLLKVSNVGMRRFGIKLAISTGVRPLLIQLKQETFTFLDTPEEPIRKLLKMLHKEFKIRLVDIAHFLRDNVDGEGREDFEELGELDEHFLTDVEGDGVLARENGPKSLYRLIMAGWRQLTAQLTALCSVEGAWRETVPREFIEYMNSREGRAYVSTYVRDLIGVYRDEIRFCVQAAISLSQSHGSGCRDDSVDGSCSVGEHLVEQFRLVLVRQLFATNGSDVSAAETRAAEAAAICHSNVNSDTAYDSERCELAHSEQSKSLLVLIVSLSLSVVEWTMDQVHWIGVYAEELLTSPVRFRESIRALLQLLLPLNE